MCANLRGLFDEFKLPKKMMIFFAFLRRFVGGCKLPWL
jgi:hypothetical protein